MTTATIAATPENTTPTTFWSISGFALPSVIHNNQPHRLVRYWYLTTHCMCTLLLLLLYRYGWQTKSRTTNGVQSCCFSLSMADLRYPPFFFGDSQVWTSLFQGLPTKSIKIPQTYPILSAYPYPWAYFNIFHLGAAYDKGWTFINTSYLWKPGPPSAETCAAKQALWSKKNSKLRRAWGCLRHCSN